MGVILVIVEPPRKCPESAWPMNGWKYFKTRANTEGFSTLTPQTRCLCLPVCMCVCVSISVCVSVCKALVAGWCTVCSHTVAVHLTDGWPVATDRIFLHGSPFSSSVCSAMSKSCTSDRELIFLPVTMTACWALSTANVSRAGYLLGSCSPCGWSSRSCSWMLLSQVSHLHATAIEQLKLNLKSGTRQKWGWMEGLCYCKTHWQTCCWWTMLKLDQKLEMKWVSYSTPFSAFRTVILALLLSLLCRLFVWLYNSDTSQTYTILAASAIA